MWSNKSLGLGKRKARFRDENGSSLVESLVAVAIIGIVIVGLIGALSVGSLAVRAASQTATAENLARSQLEQIKAASYASTYPAIIETGYNVSVAVNPVSDNYSQRITVTVSQGGNTLLVVEDLKVYR